ncbi:hypothetical protein HG535_0G04410 [Zygotorulaspora mrakii]|uniref:Securin n=1 Tax=Zygotorulaspora mrakii TaxID=42260 RepID=A0A7H9B748_ZYGMR|nr:uncharacterized protein HG535_0G04410 [Zygotorulaspora mrakii]QLG74558.1 hypothetical protein HG535_0G04410 [Zygotorulaspora mrakii]
MPRNEDKENDIIVSMDEEGVFPQTPAHLLKRTRSTVLKPPPLAEKQEPNRAKGDLKSRNVSPLRRLCVQQGRLPLASKDNNRSGGITQATQSQMQPILLKDNSTQLKKHKQPLFERQTNRSEHAHILANPRKLQKYGSVLGCNALPKMKSLVLKDVDKGGEDEDDDEDEGDNYEDKLLRSKLQGAINESKDKVYQSEKGRIGLFHDNGLEQLIRATSEKNKDEEDKEIESGPKKYESLPYIPSGYIPPNDADIEKLKTFHLPSEVSGVNDEEDSDSSRYGELLELENFSDSDEAVTENTANFKGNRYKSAEFAVPGLVELEPCFKGEGLSSKELNDLLND